MPYTKVISLDTVQYVQFERTSRDADVTTYAHHAWTSTVHVRTELYFEGLTPCVVFIMACPIGKKSFVSVRVPHDIRGGRVAGYRAEVPGRALLCGWPPLRCVDQPVMTSIFYRTQC